VDAAGPAGGAVGSGTAARAAAFRWYLGPEAERMTAPVDPKDPARGDARAMAADIAQQPGTLARLLDEGAAAVGATARRIAERRPRFVLLAGRNSCDHAALYGKYLFEIELGLPCGLTSISAVTAYGAVPHLADVLVVAVSRSGGSPELAQFMRTARRCGGTTLAVTNNPDSPLAEAAELHIDVLAGPEQAVPATKTYTAQLLALHLLVRGMRDRGAAGDPGPARALPELAARVLDRGEEVRQLAERYRFAGRMVVTSRGYGLPTAKEGALKLTETTDIPVAGSSAADLLHGPLAEVDTVSPVIAVVTEGRGGDALQPLLDRLRGRGADLLVVGPAAQAAAAPAGFALPSSGLPESLQPVLGILPLQQLAHAMAAARGNA
jgi:glucosamine--fructose-6-phosphate aminotransferase (isomerizing)